MPIYEYECEKCGHELEALQKMSDDPLKKCPECNVEQLKKKISAAAFRLKGAGWYETDFKSGKKKNLVSGEGASDSSKAATKSEPAKNPEKKAADKKADSAK